MWSYDEHDHMVEGQGYLMDEHDQMVKGHSYMVEGTMVI